MRAFVLAAVVALASAAPAQAAEPDAPDGDRVRLKWGPRAPATHGLQAAPRTPPDAEAAATLESRGEGSLFKVRLAFPQFSVMAGDGLVGLGTEQGIELEFDNHHVVSAIAEFGFGEGFVTGGGIGYSYEFVFLDGILRLQLGGTVGFHIGIGQNCSYDDDCYDDEQFAVMMFRPMLHIGYEWVFFSIGPKMAIIPGIMGGMSMGVTFRL